MKTKILTLVTIVTITILTMNSCAFLRGTGSTTQDDSLCSNYSNTDNSQLNVALIHEMTQLYQNTSKTDDTKAIWFDLETLKKFVYHLEMEAKKNNIASQDLGVRIYYARYPKKDLWNRGFRIDDLSGFLRNSITEQYELRHTVVMIPTIKIDSTHFDFNPLDSQTYVSGLTPAYFPPFKEESTAIRTFGASIDNTNAQNHGQMYPPYSAGTAF